MTIIRTKDMPPLEATILKALYQKVKKIPKDGQWRTFKGKVKIKGRPYDLECIFMIDDLFLNIKSSKINSTNNSKILVPKYINS